MTDLAPSARPARRAWLVTATTGCVLVALTLAVVALVIVDKKHFGSMVGSYFLQTITSGVLVGGLLLLVATLNLPVRGTWRGAVLVCWALVALTSPLFGILFLMPWGLLALTLPVVVRILWSELHPRGS